MSIESLKSRSIGELEYDGLHSIWIELETVPQHHQQMGAHATMAIADHVVVSAVEQLGMRFSSVSMTR